MLRPSFISIVSRASGLQERRAKCRSYAGKHRSWLDLLIVSVLFNGINALAEGLGFCFVFHPGKLRSKLECLLNNLCEKMKMPPRQRVGQGLRVGLIQLILVVGVITNPLKIYDIS